MKRQPSTVTDLLASTGPTSQTILERIERRFEVLRGWLEGGIPPGKVVPGSLNLARKWSDPELGIQPIGSPNEFTRKHPQYGKLVKDIDALQQKLLKLYSRPVSRRVSRLSGAVEKFDRLASERQLEAASSQWHSERAKRLTEKVRADSAEARSVAILEENAKMETLIADLRRQISAGRGPKAVE